MVEYKGGDFRNYLVRDSKSGVIPIFDLITIRQYKFSIQAGEFFNCYPRKTLDPFSYSSFEIGYCGRLYNNTHNYCLTEGVSNDINNDILCYVPVIEIQLMLEWYYNMLTKQQYLNFVCELDYEKGRDYIIKFISDIYLNDTLEYICKTFIYEVNENKYRERLRDYLNVRYCDLLDDNKSDNFTIDEILAKL